MVVDDKKRIPHDIALDVNCTELQAIYFAAKEKMDIDSLRKLHEQLIVISDKLDDEVSEEIHRASVLADAIPAIARREAAAGRRWASVMKLNEEDFVTMPEYGSPILLEHLVPTRAAYFLYKLCDEKDLNPEISAWHEAEGFRAGFELTINW